MREWGSNNRNGDAGEGGRLTTSAIVDANTKRQTGGRGTQEGTRWV